jgi:4-hydroxy-tetrahydrodipicolinate reductase
LQLKVGAGLTVAEFQARAREGRIGHVGLRESAALVAKALGWPVQMDRIGHSLTPVVAEQDVWSDEVRVAAGQVCGAEESVEIRPTPETSVELLLRMSLGAPGEYDEVRIEGVPPMVVRIEGGIHGDKGTAGCTANVIAPTLKAPPGLLTVLDLSVA